MSKTTMSTEKACKDSYTGKGTTIGEEKTKIQYSCIGNHCRIGSNVKINNCVIMDNGKKFLLFALLEFFHAIFSLFILLRSTNNILVLGFLWCPTEIMMMVVIVIRCLPYSFNCGQLCCSKLCPSEGSSGRRGL